MVQAATKFQYAAISLVQWYQTQLPSKYFSPAAPCLGDKPRIPATSPQCHNPDVPIRTLLAIALAAGIGAVSWFYAPLRLPLLYALGRSPDCPFTNAVDSAAQGRRQQNLHNEFVRSNQLIRKDGHYELYRTRKGDFWIPEGSRFVLPFNLAEQERRIYGSGPQFVQPGDIVLDGGANVGVFTREALAAGAKLVVAIEPAPENLECLQRNFPAAIAAGRVILYPKGIWNKEDLLTFYIDPKNSAADSFILHHDDAQPLEQKLPVTTIDLLAAELKLPKVDFIKLDIEGAEVRALEGGNRTLAKYRPRLAVSVYHKPEHPREVPRAVLAANSGYHVICGPCAEEHGTIRPDIFWFR